MLCAELREKALHFVVPPENPLRKCDVFFEKVGRFVAKRGNFFVFVAHFSIALTEFALRRGSRTESFRTFRPFVSPSRFSPSPAEVFSSRGHAPTHTSRSRTRTSPSSDFLCSPFTSLLTSSYREGCGEGNGELCVKALQVKPSHAIR